MKIFDISMQLGEDTFIYGNHTEDSPQINFVYSVNDTVRQTRMWFDLHTGTHMDAQKHMMKDGSTIDQFQLENGFNWCKVFDMTHVTNGITRNDIKDLGIEKGDFVIFKTKNSFVNEFKDDFIYVDQSASEYLVEQQIKGLGVDGLSIERSQEGFPTHLNIMKAEIVILEGLRLKEVEPGKYFLVCLPLKVANGDASPVRAVLIEKDDWKEYINQ